MVYHIVKRNRIQEIIDAVAISLVKEHAAVVGINCDEFEAKYIAKGEGHRRIAKAVCEALARQYPTTDELSELAGNDPTPTRAVDWASTLEHIGK
jgi:hypothetical protein